MVARSTVTVCVSVCAGGGSAVIGAGLTFVVLPRAIRYDLRELNQEMNISKT